MRTLLVFLLFSVCAFGQTFTKAQVFEALNMVEASGKKENVPSGDNGKAIGPLQIHKIYWTDAMEFNGWKNDRFKIDNTEYSQCQEWAYSKKVVDAYMTRYAPDSWSDSMELRHVRWVARIHNGGPSGNDKRATEEYSNKVIRILMADYK